ncbi:MAG: SUMF1/EgtB/PvdO family nonheme iron enzyme [Candidatus Sulfotelmatobacter sp.]
MHLETLAYMLHQLPLDQKIPQADPPAPPAAAVTKSMIRIAAGSVTLGLPRDSETFGWDNEFVAHNVDVGAFEIDPYKVTNRQYLEFIKAGGYETRAFWSEEDWDWKTQQGITRPIFWKQEGNEWFYRTMFDDVRLPLDWPVYVSHAEAQAYARRKSPSASRQRGRCRRWR